MTLNSIKLISLFILLSTNLISIVPFATSKIIATSLLIRLLFEIYLALKVAIKKTYSNSEFIIINTIAFITCYIVLNEHFPDISYYFASVSMLLASIVNIIYIRLRHFKHILIILFAILSINEIYLITTSSNNILESLLVLISYMMLISITFYYQFTHIIHHNTVIEDNEKLIHEIKSSKTLLQVTNNDLNRSKNELIFINDQLASAKVRLKKAYSEIDIANNKLEIKKLNENLVIHDIYNILSNCTMIEVLGNQGKCSRDVVELVSTMKNQMVDKLELLKAHKRSVFNIERVVTGILGNDLKYTMYNFKSDFKYSSVNFNYNAFVSIVHNIIQNAHEAYIQENNSDVGLMINIELSDTILTIEDNSGGLDISKIEDGYTTKLNGHGTFLNVLINNYDKYEFEDLVINNTKKGTIFKLTIPKNLFRKN